MERTIQMLMTNTGKQVTRQRKHQLCTYLLMYFTHQHLHKYLVPPTPEHNTSFASMDDFEMIPLVRDTGPGHPVQGPNGLFFTSLGFFHSNR